MKQKNFLSKNLLILTIFGGMLCQNQDLGAVEGSSAMVKSCDNIEKVSSFLTPFIVNPWQTIQMTPTGPVPGIVLALVQPESTLVDFCNMYKQLQFLDGVDKARLLKDYANVLTANKFDRQMSFALESYDVGTTINSLSKTDQKTLDKLNSMAPTLNAYLGSSNDFYNYISKSEDDTFQNRSIREANMQAVMRSARMLAQAKDLTTCEGTSDDKGQEQFKRDTSVKTEEIEYLTADKEYLVEQIGNMAQKFSSNITRYNEFQKNFIDFQNQVAQFEISEKTFDQKVSKRRLKKGKIEPGDVKTEAYDETQKRTYQVFSVKKNADILDSFKKVYSGYWKDVVRSYYLNDSFGFLDDPMTRFQKDFTDPYFECRDSFLFKKLKNSNPDLFVTPDDIRRNQKLSEKRTECIDEQSRVGVRKIDNLFSDYVELLYKTLVELKELQGDVWTTDSYYNGTVRLISKNTVQFGGANVEREQVTCSDKVNYTTLQHARMQTNAAINAMREKMVETALQRNQLLQNKLLRENEQKKKMNDSIMQREVKLRNKGGEIGTSSVDTDFGR